MRCAALRHAVAAQRLDEILGRNLPDTGLAQFACLASRFPFNSHITREGLHRVEKAEELLREMGFKQVRLRHYGTLCRIEVNAADVEALVKKRNLIVAKLKPLGYNYITVDLEGYRTGSLNEVIKR